MQIAAAAVEVEMPAIEENHNRNQMIISKEKQKQFHLPAEEQIAVVVAARAVKLRKFIKCWRKVIELRLEVILRVAVAVQIAAAAAQAVDMKYDMTF